MSTPSDTPITDKLWREYDHMIHSSDLIFDRMRELERSANEMRELFNEIEGRCRFKNRAHRTRHESTLARFDSLKERKV